MSSSATWRHLLGKRALLERALLEVVLDRGDERLDVSDGVAQSLRASYLHYVGTELADLGDDADVLRGGTDDADDAFDAFDPEGAGLAVVYLVLGVGD